MKNVYIDFNCEWYKEDFYFDENASYVSSIKRLVVGKVKEVRYKDKYINIVFGKNGLINVNIDDIEKMDIN